MPHSADPQRTRAAMQASLEALRGFRSDNALANAQHLIDLNSFPDPGKEPTYGQQVAMQRAADHVAEGVDIGGITAWHGTPHVFSKFDPSKIGTGEGAQVYGHGLYLAEAKEVAEKYARDIAQQRKAYTIGGQAASSPEEAKAATYVYNSLQKGDRSPQQVVADARALFERLGKYDPKKKAELDEVAKHIERIGGAPVGLSNNVLKVDLPDEHVANMIDWDKPMTREAQAPGVLDRLAASNQYSVKEALETMGNRWASTGSPGKGSEFIRSVNAVARDPNGMRWPQAVSADDLSASGIAGVRHLDAYSRDGQVMTPTSNFVVFPQFQPDLNILERNGQDIQTQAFIDALRSK